MVRHPLVLLFLLGPLEVSQVLGGVDGVEEENGLVKGRDVGGRGGGVNRAQLRLREEEESRDLSSCGVGSEEEGTKGKKNQFFVRLGSIRDFGRTSATKAERGSEGLLSSFLYPPLRKERRKSHRCTTYRYGSCWC